MNPVEFYDEIFGYYHTPWWQQMWFYITLACLICLLLGFGIFLLIKRRQKPQLPWEWALKALHVHTPNRCVNKEDFKKFYFQLTGIMKEYLYRTYGWDIQDKTDNELVAWLEQSRQAKIIVMTATKISEGAQLIKFANMDALKSQADDDWNAVIAMVDETKQTDTK